MINTKMKSARGISLISLVITTIVLIILANVIIYNVRDELRLGKLENMQNDIENLKDKISSYYAQNGKIPASLKYTNVNDIKNAGVISNEVDTGEFFVIDLSALENLTLNYGRDYEKVKEMESLTDEDAKNYTDLYIINEASHNIFYVAGITVDNENYYTDYTADSIDTTSVDLRYVDGVKIPNGYSYVEGNKGTGIIIQNDTNDKIYKWVVVNEMITKVPNDIVVDEDDKDEFLDSVNRFKGYYRNNSDDTVVYIEVIESWSPEYDSLGIYKDKNEDIAYIPEGFKVSNKPGETLIDEGLVVKGPDESEFVWIPVSDITTMATETSGTDSNGRTNYQGKLYDFSGTKSTEMTNYGQETTSYREPSSINRDPADTYASMQEEYNAMIESVIKYGGFYIGRYEMSLNTDKTEAQSKKGVVLSKASDADTSGWYGLYGKAKNYQSTKVTSSMIWGSQYDAMLNWILTGSDASKVSVSKYENHSSNLKNAGETKKDKINNIYDLEGNLIEYSLEAQGESYRVMRGGGYLQSALATERTYENSFIQSNYSYCGSRITLYIK